MADSYSFVKGGKLTLKGNKDKKLKKHKHKKRKHEESSMGESSSTVSHNKEDTQSHGMLIQHGDDVRPGPSHTGPAVAGPAVAGPSHAGPSYAGPAVAGPSHAGPAVAGPSHAGPARRGRGARGGRRGRAPQRRGGRQDQRVWTVPDNFEPVIPAFTANEGIQVGWWQVKKFDDISGNIALEIGNRTYVSALDNGLLTLGPPRSDGEPPDPTEVFTVLKLSETKVAFKSGYGKYLSVDMERRVVGRSEAIANREQFEPVFQDGQMALNGCNSCFVSMDDDGDVVCQSSTAGSEHMIKLRSNLSIEEDPLEKVPKEERGSVKDTEVNYVKKFQSFQDRRLRINQNDRAELKEAKKHGEFHEKLLDRREKMKADRYCK